VGVSQTLRRRTQGATYICQGDHHLGHWPRFLVIFTLTYYYIYNYDDDDDDDKRLPADPIDYNALDLVKVVSVQHGGTRAVDFHLIQRFRSEVDVIDGVSLRA